MRFGPDFRRPSKKSLRIHRAEQGPNFLKADAIRRMIDSAGLPLKAMIFLAINCGFGNHDCCKLPLSALDLEGGWVTFPRPKTGIPRGCKLWPETVATIREALAKRPTPKSEEDAALCFVTKYGAGWGKEDEGGPVTKETAKLMKKLGIKVKKRGGFYTLRHVYRTVADETKDQVAVDFTMGHENGSMATVYRETIGDERLRAVAEYVRAWLYGMATTA